jgi:hypothetical protein
MMKTLTDSIKALAEARVKVISIEDDRIDLEMETNRLFRVEHPDLVEKGSILWGSLIKARDELEAIEAEVRAGACAAFVESGNKNPAPGVSVVISTGYEYPTDEAFRWAKAHELALRLDEKAFNAICKSDSSRPDFVKVTQTPSARIATDLEKALGVGNDC